MDVSDFNFTEPILGYDPSDPDNPYPFGIPVDNFFPADLMEFSNSGIMLLAAVQGSIPDEMWDNSILRALAYTGYNVQKLKDNGWLYRYEYVGSRLKTNAPDVMTNIGYGAGSNGNETIADPSTPTGRAPDISYFERNGLVCASFVAYYLSNYLPNVEGVDTSHIINKVQELSGGNMRAVSNWRTGLSASPAWKRLSVRRRMTPAKMTALRTFTTVLTTTPRGLPATCWSIRLFPLCPPSHPRQRA